MEITILRSRYFVLAIFWSSIFCAQYFVRDIIDVCLDILILDLNSATGPRPWYFQVPWQKNLGLIMELCSVTSNFMLEPRVDPLSHHFFADPLVFKVIKMLHLWICLFYRPSEAVCPLFCGPKLFERRCFWIPGLETEECYTFIW